jgi:undecaprenyl-diphosphatase
MGPFFHVLGLLEANSVIASMTAAVRRGYGVGVGADRRSKVRLVVALACAVTVLLVLVQARWTPLRRLDDAATRATNAFMWRHPALVGPLRATAYVFHPWVFRAVVLFLAWRAARRGHRRAAVWAVATMVVAGVVEGSLKALTGRPRPLLPSPIAHASGGSFPSGHALTAAAGGAVIVLLLRPAAGVRARAAWTAAVVVSLITGASRVLLGVHYVSDVTAGWIIGTAIVVATCSATKLPFE